MVNGHKYRKVNPAANCLARIGLYLQDVSWKFLFHTALEIMYEGQ